MGFPKRPSEVKRLISRLDPSLAIYDRETLKKYHETLDISVIENCDKTPDELALVGKPFIFHAMPLRAKFANLHHDQMTAGDWWNIFRTHVNKIENIPPEWNIKKDGDMLDETVRELFSDEVVQDVGMLIYHWANGDGDLIPFPVQGFCLARQDIYRRKLHAK